MNKGKTLITTCCMKLLLTLASQLVRRRSLEAGLSLNDHLRLGVIILTTKLTYRD